MHAAFAPPVHFLSTYNRNQMKDVFLGKGTWAVLCSGEGAAYDSVYKRFATASKALKGSVKFGVVDCAGSLPSGKNILEKFSLSVRISSSKIYQEDPFSFDESLILRECLECRAYLTVQLDEAEDLIENVTPERL